MLCLPLHPRPPVPAFFRKASHAFAVRAGARPSSSSATSEKQRKLANMFAPPTSIMFIGDFQAARQVPPYFLH